MGSKFSADPDQAQALAFIDRYGISEAELPGFIKANLICLRVLAKHAQLQRIAECLQVVLDEMEQNESS